MATWPGAGKGLPLQGNVFAVTWEGSGKALKAHGRVSYPGGPCFAAVLKPSKWIMATWPGAGKAVAKRQTPTERFRVLMDRASQWF